MKVKSAIWRARRLFRNRRQLLALADCGSRVPQEQRKGRLHRLLELVYIAAKWDEYSTAYYAQGADQKGKSLASEFLALGHFNDKRKLWNCNRLYPDVDYSAVFEDKLLFERYFGGQGFPVVRSMGVLLSGMKFHSWNRGIISLLEEGAPREFGDAFCKPIAGRYGRGATRFGLKDDQLLVNGMPGKSFLQEIGRPPYLVQERIVQHSQLAAYHSSSLNTVRLVSTLQEDGTPRLLGGFFRMGVGGAVVDNASSGGVVCGFDLDTGGLNSEGWQVSKSGFKSISAHPTTGRQFAGGVIPFFREAVELVCRAHRIAPWIRSVGWDIGIQDDGPVLIEGNERWGPLSLMWVDPAFVGRVRLLMGDM